MSINGNAVWTFCSFIHCDCSSVWSWTQNEIIKNKNLIITEEEWQCKHRQTFKKNAGFKKIPRKQENCCSWNRNCLKLVSQSIQFYSTSCFVKGRRIISLIKLFVKWKKNIINNLVNSNWEIIKKWNFKTVNLSVLKFKRLNFLLQK